jgi:predicted patatin/cPLA2 family phospholipase
MKLARTSLVALILLMLSLAACSSPTRLPAVPPALADRAVVLGLPCARTWEDTPSEEFLSELIASAKREIDWRASNGDKGPLPPVDYLAISGGGANGAYGAGLLCGWTAKGTRPEFKVVTGISTGALTAPFVFLGPKYDEKLRKLYTSVNTAQIAEPRSLLAAVFDDALMDTAPLRRLLAEQLDDQMIADIAKEYARGRLLLIATTNLDSGRSVIWNIGAIASTGTPEGYKLIREVLIASAAIPVAFPPVMIDVEVAGKKYQEMHVDGGATAQVFLYPTKVMLRATSEEAGIFRVRRAYIIRNARLDPHWADVQRRTLSIAARSIDSLIQSQGVGDLYRIYFITQRDGVDFNLSFIPSKFVAVPDEDFDPAYMSDLFDLGYKSITDGNAWIKQPPTQIEDSAAIKPAPPLPPAK